ncbi:MAG: alkaline phosphatase family protein [Caldilineaceae bacterium]
MLKFLKKRRPRLLVLGLDGFAPELVFSQWRSHLPTFDRLLSEGAFGTLQSSVPCVSIPAWNVITSGKDPGTIGIYGIENRRQGSYDDVKTAFGSATREPAVWEILGEAGKRVVTMGVPGTYPPRQVNGVQISCHLTPQTTVIGKDGRRRAAEFTYPGALGDQINQWAGGEYMVDVAAAPTHDLEDQIHDIYRMSDLHFNVMRKLLAQQMWDFFISVEVGASRLQQRFWQAVDGSCDDDSLQCRVRDYYQYIDGKIAQLMEQMDADTALMIVSDHGIQRTAGSISVNDWLIDEEWLTVDTPLEGVQPFNAQTVDWANTLAWAEGGEFTRFFLNVEDREAQGVIPWSRYLQMRDELVARIEDVRGPNGERLNTQIFKPEETYRHLHGVVPDLIVYWDNLRWRSVNDLGHPSIWISEGADTAAPTPNGMYVYWHPKQKYDGHELVGWEIMDVAPTILNYFQVPIPIEMQGRSIPLSTSVNGAGKTPPPPVVPERRPKTTARLPVRKTRRRRTKLTTLQPQQAMNN